MATSKLIDLNFQIKQSFPSPWMIEDVCINGDRRVDTTLRKSKFIDCQIPETNSLPYKNQTDKSPTQWRAHKYDNGYFKQHVDHQVHPKHNATQILLPPKNQCSYEGGELILYEDKKENENEKTTAILPDEFLWTHIIIPLGVKHQVRQVKGIRISFVRSIYGEEDFTYNTSEIKGTIVTN